MSFEQPVRNANYPELVYWFITPETFAPGRVEQDVKHITNDTPLPLHSLPSVMAFSCLRTLNQQTGSSLHPAQSGPRGALLSQGTVILML